MILLDTNVLVYAVDAEAAQHAASRCIVRAALDGKVPGVLVPQVLLEFLAVVTHPRRVARPMEPLQAWKEVSGLRSALPVLEVLPRALTVLGNLLSLRPAAGGNVFDLFIVAQMSSHGVKTICTYDGPHFSVVPGIEALTPEDVVLRHGFP